MRLSLDAVGAVTGPLVAVALMILLSGDICGVLMQCVLGGLTGLSELEIP